MNGDAEATKDLGELLGLVAHRAEEDDDVAGVTARWVKLPAASSSVTCMGDEPSCAVSRRIRWATSVASRWVRSSSSWSSLRGGAVVVIGSEIGRRRCISRGRAVETGEAGRGIRQPGVEAVGLVVIDVDGLGGHQALEDAVDGSEQRGAAAEIGLEIDRPARGSCSSR